MSCTLTHAMNDTLTGISDGRASFRGQLQMLPLKKPAQMQ
jgi:hypothetical protein